MLPVPPPCDNAAVESYALSHKLKRVPGPDPQYEDICFGNAPAHNDLEALSKVFPSMEIQFDQVGRWGSGNTDVGKLASKRIAQGLRILAVLSCIYAR